eukprot:SAG22_NODE_5929_length_929_cov_0.849398_1_plen_61_part_00
MDLNSSGDGLQLQAAHTWAENLERCSVFETQTQSVPSQLSAFQVTRDWISRQSVKVNVAA